MRLAGAALLAAGVAVATLGCGDFGATATARSDAPKAAAALALADSVLTRAESLYWASEYDSAATLWSAALADSRSSGDRARETRVLTWLGLTTRQQGDLAAARSHLDGALRVGLDVADPALLLEAHNALGLVAQDEDRMAEARRHFEEALLIAQKSGNSRGMAKTSGNLGLTYAYLGEHASARRLLTILRDSGHALGDPRYEANGMANLAMLDIWEGHSRSAIPALDSARALYRAARYLPGEQNALGQLATAYEELGEYGSAFAALDSSLTLARSAGMKEDETEILRLLAGLHARVGDYRAAMRYYAETAKLAAELDLTGALGSVRRSTAAIHLELGDVEPARRDAREALRLHRAAALVFDELDDILVLAEIEGRSGRHADAARLLAAAGPIADTLGARSAKIAVALTSARLADRANDPSRVLRALRDADSLLMPGDFAGAGETHALAARAYARRGALDSAVVAGRRAIAAIEHVRGNLASEQLRRTLLADRGAVYADHVLTLLRLDRVAEAFSVADAARSRGLAEYLASARDEFRRGRRVDVIGEGERLLREIDALLATLKSLDSVPARERSPGSVITSVELMARLERSRAAYEALLARAGREHPRAAALLGVRATVTEDVQRALDADEALLEYLVASDRVVLFVATRSALRTVEIASGSGALADRVRLLREIWGSREVPWQTGLPAARALHRTLLGDALRSNMLDGVRRLVIVPHGVLAQLPFAALVNERNGRFVVQDFEVMYLPSAGTLPALRQETSADHQGPLGGSAFAPFPRDLPASAAEVAVVRGALPEVRTHVGGTATESAVRAALAERGLVHVASHGVLNSHNPMFTRIELARPARRMVTDDDGRLEVHELIAMVIRSPLVFLSGCETSALETWLDDAVRGSDHTTLAQSLLYAGAGNVLGTLWRIDDAGAAAFAKPFYRSLSGAAVARSLASAQRAMLGSSRFAHPYYWAGYLLTGEGRFGS